MGEVTFLDSIFPRCSPAIHLRQELFAAVSATTRYLLLVTLKVDCAALSLKRQSRSLSSQQLGTLSGSFTARPRSFSVRLLQYLIARSSTSFLS